MQVIITARTDVLECECEFAAVHNALSQSARVSKKNACGEEGGGEGCARREGGGGNVLLFYLTWSCNR